MVKLDGAKVTSESIKWLLKDQNKDGGWGEPESNCMSTTMGAYSLYRLGETEAAEKGTNWLLGSQMPSGGWIYKYRGGHLLRDNPEYRNLWAMELTVPTSMSLLTLLYAGNPLLIKQSVERGIKWLLGRQEKNGAFGPNSPLLPNTGDTSLALWSISKAISTFGNELNNLDTLHEKAGRAGRYMVSSQANDGSYPAYSWLQAHPFLGGMLAFSKEYATAEAMCGLVQFEDFTGNLVKSKSVKKGLSWLLKVQNKDGGWGLMGQSRVEETAYVILLAHQLMTKGVNRFKFNKAAEKGLRWLLKDNKDGEWRKDLRHTATFNSCFAAMVLPKGKSIKVEP
ncbi:MAG: terpene cyclase/mutase family protein [Candidatus Diapherotrites archaeon]|nr:terpene cyclase/mutase family protein [Candidatus Diapherotrites archaeon]